MLDCLIDLQDWCCVAFLTGLSIYYSFIAVLCDVDQITLLPE